MPQGKRKIVLFLIVFIISFSYILTSINNWTFYSRVGEFTKYTYVMGTDITLIGKSFAPFQYRILQPILVQFVFRHLALPWRDDMGEIVENGLKTDDFFKTLLSPQKSSVAKLFPSQKDFNKMAVDYLRNALVKLGVSPTYRFFFLFIAPTVNWYEKVETAGSTTFRVLNTIFPGFLNVDEPGTYEYSMVNGAITSEFIYLIITMLFLFLILIRFVDYKYAFVGLLLFSATLGLTFNVTAPESALALMLVTIGFYMVVKDVSVKWLIILITIGSFARADQMLFIGLIYLANHFFKEKAYREKLKIIYGIVLCAIPFAVMAFLMLVLFPSAPNNYPLSNLIYNLTNPWAYVYVLALFNVEFLFIGELFKDSFYKRTLIALGIFIVIDLIGGMVEEVRILMPAYIFMLPATIKGIKNMFSGA
ncbi:hypothetical protein [Mesoaciditoga lauensis]|uniref:hypothetical protein n=1 Tax=Mesoaciditoga lauensis TaxID=1495039 RepID=UPI00056C4C70|nr:hypothetical protein [Mesoaciditoga lauensis]